VSILTAILNTLVVIICLFLICLILIQRGKGGGLAGAFGGVGGSSAFGTKAGDVFTRVTTIVAAAWILISMILVVLYNRNTHSAWGDESASKSREVLSKPKDKAGKAGAVPPISIPTPPGSPAPALPSSPAPSPSK
jgi:preprotein translocase subunit SecG